MQLAHAPMHSRSGTRFPARLGVELVLEGGRLRGTTRNVSFGGVFIDAPLVLARDTRLRLRLTLPAEIEPLEVGGSVRWTAPGGFGVRFSGLRFRDVWTLGRFLEELSGGVPAGE
jgi:hypothetical protein